MQTGIASAHLHREQHRDAVIVNAVQVFCTFVQHDIARMDAAGITGDVHSMFTNAVKHQLLRGIGKQMGRIVDRIIEHEDHMPTFTDSNDRQLIACIMRNYAQSLHAIRMGADAAKMYRTNIMVPSIMTDALQLRDDELTDTALDAFTESMWQCIDEWEAYQPRGHFDSVIHNTVLNSGAQST